MFAKIAPALFALCFVAAAQADMGRAFQESQAQEAAGHYVNALAKMARLTPRSAPATYMVHLRRGWLLYKLGKHGAAIDAYQRAIAAEPGSVEARLGATLPMMALRRWADAERVLQRALAAAPGNYTAQSRLAYVRYQAGRFKAAGKAYAAVLKAFPGDVEMRAGLGWSLLKQGQLAPARAEFERVLLVAPDHVSAKAGLGARR